jgi:minor extracellular serine protease Vpr
MKNCLALLMVIMSISPAFSQGASTKPKLSAFTQQYLLATKAQSKGQLLPTYVYKKINSKTYISALIKVGTDIDEAALSSLGIFTGTKAGNIWTVQVPVENVATFTTTPGISYIQLDMPIVPALDSARRQTRADSAQAGINLPSPITGEHVLVGVIDAGFDFNHPTFYDTTHSAYRIRRVWTQKIGGTPPAGFSYGNELTDSDAIRALGYDTAILSHGTHVTGIAAGSGYGSNTANSRFRGMAFQSDIALVGIMPAPSEWIAAGESDIIDGMNYLYTYAASISEPAVVNLSWSSTLGPHDGNSLFSQACDALTGPGKIFVCAAGNNGEDTVHLQKSFTAADTTVSTFVTFSPYLDSNHQMTWVDVWGDTGNTFCVNVKLCCSLRQYSPEV